MISLWGLKIIGSGFVTSIATAGTIYLIVSKSTEGRYSDDYLIMNGNDNYGYNGYYFPYTKESDKWKFVYVHNRFLYQSVTPKTKNSRFLSDLTSKANLENHKGPKNYKKGQKFKDICISLLKNNPSNSKSFKSCLFKSDRLTEELFYKYTNYRKINGNKNTNNGNMYLDMILDNENDSSTKNLDLGETK